MDSSPAVAIAQPLDLASPINQYVTNRNTDVQAAALAGLTRAQTVTQGAQAANLQADTSLAPARGRLLSAQAGEAGANASVLHQQAIKGQWDNMTAKSQSNAAAAITLSAMVKPALDGGDTATAKAIVQEKVNDPLYGAAAKDLLNQMNSSPDLAAVKGVVDAHVKAGDTLGIIPKSHEVVPMGGYVVNRAGATVNDGAGGGTANPPQAAASGPPLSGAALLAAPKSPATDHDIANQAIADGTAKMPTYGFRTPMQQKLWESEVADSHRIDPTTNMDRPAAVAYWNSGPGAVRAQSAGALSNHLQSVRDLMKALDNGNVQVANQIGNSLGVHFGANAATNMDIGKQFLSAEATKFITNNGGTGGDREGLQADLETKLSNNQLVGAADTMVDFMGGQLESMGNNFTKATGNKDFAGQLNPAAKDILQGYKQKHAGTPASAGGSPEGITATNTMGHKVISKDGGKTWQSLVP